MVNENYKVEINKKKLILPLWKLKLFQKPMLFLRILSDNNENENYISRSNPVIMFAHISKTSNEFTEKAVSFQSLVKSMRCKKLTIVKDDLEFSIYEIGESSLLFLCLFKSLEDSLSCEKMRCKEIEAITFEPPLWKAIVSETILQIPVPPADKENCQMLLTSPFKLVLNFVDSVMSPGYLLRKLNTKNSNLKENQRAQFSDSNILIYVVLGWSGNSPAESIEVFDVTKQRWLFFQRQTHLIRSYYGMVLLGCNLYVFGGFNGDECLQSTDCFNLETREWCRKSSMSVARCYVFGLNYQGYIYAFGGHNGINRMKSCERYDPKVNTWIRISDMMYKRSDASGAELNGRIYVCGGFDGFQFHRTTEMYDPETDEWTLVANLIRPRSGHSMVTFNGQLFVLGGFGGRERLRAVERYNEDTDEWEFYVPMITGRSNFCCVALKQEIYVIGGYTGISTTDDVEVFNMNLMDWQPAPSLNVHRSAARACAFSNSVNVCNYTLNEIIPRVSTDIEETSP